MQFHGDCHTHIDALCHIAYRGELYNGRPAGVVTTSGAGALDITEYAQGVVGRGVLLDIPRLRGVPWLEPGTAVSRAELEAAEQAEGVHLDEGDLFVFRTGHHYRRLELGPWDNGYSGEGKAGLHVDVIPLLHERHVAGFLPDGDGDEHRRRDPLPDPSPADHRHGHAGLRQSQLRGPGGGLCGRAALGVPGCCGPSPSSRGNRVAIQSDRGDVAGSSEVTKLLGPKGSARRDAPWRPPRASLRVRR
jgi:hypothetical protein